MRVFILGTGRNGSSTIIKACQHITNFTSSHESRTKRIGPERLAYPDDHIEADNRLSWHTGELDQLYGQAAFYVYLKRERKKVAASSMRRYYQPISIIDSYCGGIKMIPPEKLNREERLQACYDYVDTVNANIELFLKDKPHQFIVNLETISADFEQLWERIGAAGDKAAALAEFEHAYNASAKRRPLNLFYRLKLLVIREVRHWSMVLGLDVN
ncbi:MAG: hypothetical protein AAFP77_18085 [Bacteroidota bacterium]